MITLINGFPQSAGGLIVPLGAIRFQLNVDATVIAAPGGFVAADIPIVFQFDAAGKLLLVPAAKLWSNAELQPQLSSTLLGTYYLVTFYDQNGAVLNATPMWWQFPEANGVTVDISQMTPISTVGGNIIFYPTNFAGGTGSVTSVTFTGDGTVLSATPSAAVTVSGTLIATLLTQSANTVLAGPTSGPAGSPTFRVLALADIAGLVPWSSLVAATGNLTLANAGFTTTFNQTSAVNWIWANTTAATNSANQNSPILNLDGAAWNGSASTTAAGTIQIVVGSGSNPIVNLAVTITGSTGNLGMTLPPSITLRNDNSQSGFLAFQGSSTGSAAFTVNGSAGSPNALALPTTTPVMGQILSNTGGNPTGMIWITGASTKVAINLTAQTAAITTSNLIASVATAGQYRLNWNAKVTTVDGASSTLGALTIVYTDPDGVAQTITCAAQVAGGTIATSSAGNLTTTVLLGMPILLNCKAATAVTYAFGYASGTPATMTYNLHINLESFVG